MLLELPSLKWILNQELSFKRKALLYARQNANITTKPMKGKKNKEKKVSENYIIEIPKIKEFENLCLPLSVITAALLEKGKILKEKEYIRKGNVF